MPLYDNVVRQYEWEANMQQETQHASTWPTGAINNAVYLDFVT
jgi:hypothetical protein